MSGVDYDITVVGAGLVGLAFVSAMKNSGWRVQLIEAGDLPQRDSDEFDLRVNSIHLGSVSFLKAIGAWELVAKQRACPYNAIRVWEPFGGHIEFDADEIDEVNLGYIVENNVLTTSLLEQVQNENNIELRSNTVLNSIQDEDNAVRIQLNDDVEVTTSLVVGADGGNSTVRQMTGISVSKESYQQEAIIARVGCEDQAEGIAHQRFLPTGPLAFLPLSDGSYSIVWSCAMDRSKELFAMSDEDFEVQLSEALENRLGKTRLLSRRVRIGLRKVKAESYFSNRVVLVGDAAHVIHPLAGMGANLGLMDAAALYQVLTTGTRSENDPWNYTRIRQYERWRKSVNSPVMGLMDWFDRRFRKSNDFVQTTLGVGMTMTNRMGLVKHNIMRMACGISGELPDLAKPAKSSFKPAYREAHKP